MSTAGDPSAPGPPSDRPALGRLVSVPGRRPGADAAASDVEGLDLLGTPVRLRVDGERPSLLLFLGTSCDGCLPFWAACADPRALGLDPCDDVVVVIRAASREDRAELRRLLPDGDARPTLVLSASAWAAYRVQGPPFFALVHRRRVVTEGVAWSAEQVAEDVGRARAQLGRSGTGPRDGK